MMSGTTRDHLVTYSHRTVDDGVPLHAICLDSNKRRHPLYLNPLASLPYYMYNRLLRSGV
uniref:Uncharacterized protein n=1 Tax=Setaria italica TaxID=4555 RepID=K3XST0_SETIT